MRVNARALWMDHFAQDEAARGLHLAHAALEVCGDHLPSLSLAGWVVATLGHDVEAGAAAISAPRALAVVRDLAAVFLAELSRQRHQILRVGAVEADGLDQAAHARPAELEHLLRRVGELEQDRRCIEHVLGRYMISDKPMTEEQWTRERATVIDVMPEKKTKGWGGELQATPGSPAPDPLAASP